MSDDIVREFLVESNENLDSLDRELVQLEKNPTNRDTLSSVFRTIHTIKGTCGFLGFTKLESVAHVGENLLSRLRDGELALNPEITTALLRMVDAIRQVLQSVEANGNEGERNDENLIATLTRLHPGAPPTLEKNKQSEADPLTQAATPKPPVNNVSAERIAGRREVQAPAKVEKWETFGGSKSSALCPLHQPCSSLCSSCCASRPTPSTLVKWCNWSLMRRRLPRNCCVWPTRPCTVEPCRRNRFSLRFSPWVSGASKKILLSSCFSKLVPDDK